MKPDFPSLVDEIAEPRPDMNIKITVFTASEKSIIISVSKMLAIFQHLNKSWLLFT